eukprot:12535214-Ditylum_brightwellii.AAC.1
MRRLYATTPTILNPPLMKSILLLLLILLAVGIMKLEVHHKRILKKKRIVLVTQPRQECIPQTKTEAKMVLSPQE